MNAPCAAGEHEGQRTQPLNQHIRQSCQQDAQEILLEVVATCACGKQVHLSLFDAVFCLPALAV